MRETRAAIAAAVLVAAWAAAPLAAAVPGRLRVDTTNPRWVTNDTNKSIVLSGSHTWNINQDYKNEVFNWMGFQNRIDGLGHNFTRGWTFEDGHYKPTLWTLVNGQYDLNQVNHAQWTSTSGNLRKRVRRARQKGLYTSIMLFQGWSIWDFQVGSSPLRTDNPWAVHPFKLSNNRNGINGDFIASSTRRQGQEIHEDRGENMSNQITGLQLAYVAFVVDKMKGFKNILWEVSNESPGGTNFRKWQNAVVDRIWQRDRNSLIMISCQAGSSLTTLSQMLAMNSRARVIAPCVEDGRGFRIGSSELTNPEAAPGDRIRVADSDHINPLDVTRDLLWAWKYFLRGYHPIFMDLGYDLTWARDRNRWNPNDPRFAQIASSLGAIQGVVAGVELRALVPQNRNVQLPVKRKGNLNRAFALYSSGSPGAGLNRPANGAEFLVLEPNGAKRIRICQLTAGRDYAFKWMDPFVGNTVSSGTRQNVGNCRNFDNPRSSGMVLHVARQ